MKVKTISCAPWIFEKSKIFIIKFFLPLYSYKRLKIENEVLPSKQTHNICFRKILLWKIFMHRRGGHHGFVRTFCLTGPKRKALWRSPSVFRKLSGIEKKFMNKSEHITIFRRNFYVSRCRKLSLGNSTVFEKIFGFKKFCGWKGGYHVFPSKILVS